jgi:hypothetical protein
LYTTLMDSATPLHKTEVWSQFAEATPFHKTEVWSQFAGENEK